MEDLFTSLSHAVEGAPLVALSAHIQPDRSPDSTPDGSGVPTRDEDVGTTLVSRPLGA